MSIKPTSSSLRGWRFVRVTTAAAVVAVVVASVASAVDSRAASAPANSSLPSISGSVATGSTVTANPGTWTGSSPIIYQYQWQICGGDGNACHGIGGATAQTYQIRTQDQGNTLRVGVIASNSDGSASAVSPATGRIAAGATAPVNTASPSISGTPAAGGTLTAVNGTWTGTSPIAFAYRWEICDGNGNACHDISGATSQSYQVQPADAGNTVRVRVSGTNGAGSSSATSAASAKVAVAAPATGCPTMATGAQSVPVASISTPARLQVTSFASTPRTIPGTMRSFQVQVHIADTCGQAVQGAQVYATAVPYDQVSIPAQTMTDGAGNTTLQFNRMTNFPAARHQRLMVLFVRATKPGESLLAGISTRRLISLRVDLNAAT